MSIILKIENLCIGYQNRTILENLNLEIHQGEIVCFMGKSGSGKSTFLSALNGFLNEKCGHSSGNIFFNGENIKEKESLWLKRKMAILFQDAKPFPFSIERNLTYAMEFYEGKRFDQHERVVQLLKDVNLYDEIKGDLTITPEALSGGQKQRLCIARMLTSEPDILIFDEPCSSLDIKNQLVIEALIKKLAKKYTILLATHHLEQARRLTKRIMIIENKQFKNLYCKD